MIQAFLRTYFPPMPVLDLSLCAPGSDGWNGPFTAVVDSGADYTIVPWTLLKPLDPPVVRPATLSSQWQGKRSVYVYEVDLRIGTMILPGIDVAGDPFSDDVLLGRNVLNRLDLRLEGPSLRTQVLG